MDRIHLPHQNRVHLKPSSCRWFDIMWMDAMIPGTQFMARVTLPYTYSSGSNKRKMPWMKSELTSTSDKNVVIPKIVKEMERNSFDNWRADGILLFRCRCNNTAGIKTYIHEIWIYLLIFPFWFSEKYLLWGLALWLCGDFYLGLILKNLKKASKIVFLWTICVALIVA